MNSLIESVRRTTVTTYDIEASLMYYRDTLGMTTWYDDVFDDPVVREIYDLPDNTITRVCILQATTESPSPRASNLVAGMVGLMHFEGLEGPSIPNPVRRPLPGEIVLMFSSTRLLELEAKLKKEGYDLHGPPIKLNTPGRSVVYELLGRDPNGIRVAFVQQSEIY